MLARKKIRIVFQVTLLAFFITPELIADSLPQPAALPELDCVIEPHMVSEVSSQVDGVVDSVFVERGELVEAGQTLVKLDTRVEQATLAYAKRRATATGGKVSSRRQGHHCRSRVRS